MSGPRRIFTARSTGSESQYVRLMVSEVHEELPMSGPLIPFHQTFAPSAISYVDLAVSVAVSMARERFESNLP